MDATNRIPLSPCPFCGGQAAFVDGSLLSAALKLSGEQLWFAQCTNHAGALNPSSPCGAFQSGRTPEEAARKWNQRPASAPVVMIEHSVLNGASLPAATCN